MPDTNSTVTQILREAREAVEAAQLPDSLHVAAFEKAVDMLAADAGVAVAAPTLQSPAAAATAGPAAPIPPVGADRTLAKVASRLGVSMTSVDEVFHVENETPALSVGTAKLDSQNSVAVKEIALLMAAVRQGGGWDVEWTATAEIRAVAENYGRYDSNFAAHVLAMDDAFAFSGSGRSRKVKLKKRGWENAAALVKRLAGEEDS